MARTQERERRRHKPLSSEALKRRADQKGDLYDSLAKPGIKVWRPKPAKHTIRFFEGTWPDAEHWAHDTWIHNSIGPDGGRYFCLQKMLGKPCALCDEYRALKAAGENDAAKAIAVRKGAAAWLIDRDAEEDGPQLWFYGRTVDEEIAGRCRNRKTGEPMDIIHPDEGNDVFFENYKEGKEASNVKYRGYEIDRDMTPIHDREKLQNKWLDYVEENPVPDCFNYYDNEYLKDLITGARMSKVADEEDDEDVDERPRGRRSRSIDDDDDDKPRSRRRREEPEYEEDDDPPPRRRRARDEDYNDEEDDKPASRRRRVSNDDDDEPPPRRRRPRDADEDETDEDRVPSRRSRKDDTDEDDDHPRRRRVRAEDDDENDTEDTPEPKRKRTRLEDDEPVSNKRRAVEDDNDDEDVVDQAKRQLKRLKDEEETDKDDDPPPRRKRRGL